MTFDAAATAAAIEADLRAVGSPQRARAEKRYLKSDLRFVGASVGDIRRVVKARLRPDRPSGHRELRALVEELWSVPIHERRMAAVVVLEDNSGMLTVADMKLIERLVRESRTWALVDGLAARVAGDLVARLPVARRTLDRWASADDFWVRRSALLATMRWLKEGGDFDLFGRHAEAMLEEREFFIRKAIGWVLRDVSRTRPDEVWRWLAPRARRASGVTMREAVKYLSPDHRKDLLAAHRATRRNPPRNQ